MLDTGPSKDFMEKMKGSVKKGKFGKMKKKMKSMKKGFSRFGKKKDDDSEDVE